MFHSIHIIVHISKYSQRATNSSRSSLIVLFKYLSICLQKVKWKVQLNKMRHILRGKNKLWVVFVVVYLGPAPQCLHNCKQRLQLGLIKCNLRGEIKNTRQQNKQIQYGDFYIDYIAEYRTEWGIHKQTKNKRCDARHGKNWMKEGLRMGPR